MPGHRSPLAAEARLAENYSARGHALLLLQAAPDIDSDMPEPRPRVFYESVRRLNWLLAALLAVLALNLARAVDYGEIVTGLLAGIFFSFLLVLAWLANRYKKFPLIILSIEGFLVGDPPTRVPWTSVESASFQQWHGMTICNILLTDAAALPVSFRQGLRVRWRPARCELRIVAQSFRRPQQAGDLAGWFHAYMQAASLPATLDPPA